MLKQYANGKSLQKVFHTFSTFLFYFMAAVILFYFTCASSLNEAGFLRLDDRCVCGCLSSQPTHSINEIN